jgi:hypothetical protein
MMKLFCYLVIDLLVNIYQQSWVVLGCLMLGDYELEQVFDEDFDHDCHALLAKCAEG